MPTDAADQGGVRIARNTGYLTVAFIIQKALSFGFFIYYARVLGPGDTGKLVTAISLATLFGIFIDLGFSPILIREVSRAKERAQELLSNILWIKIFFSIITYLALVIFVYVLSGNYNALTRQLIFFAGGITILESLTLSLYGVFRGFQNLKHEAIGSTLFQFFAVAFGVIAMQITQSVYIPALSLLFGAGVNFLYALIALWKKHKITFSLAHQTKTLTFLIQLLWPFLIAGIFTRIYAFIDVVILSLFATDVHVGWYSAANKILLAIQFIPIAFNNSVYPALSTFFVSDPGQFRRLFARVMFFLASIAFPLTAGIVVLADRIIPILSDAYNESIFALQIIAFALFFMFVNVIFSSYLNAANAQKRNTFNLGIIVVINVTLNLILVPLYQHIGTSIALLATAIALFLLNAYSAHKVMPLQRMRLLSGFLRTAFAGAGMALIILLVKSFLSFPFVVLVGIVSYAMLWLLFGGQEARESVALFRRLFMRKSL
ncbi:MAG: flippase [Patescibacteria group bacterium]|jgi:O-antigen/teichoic acid export membrane protein